MMTDNAMTTASYVADGAEPLAALKRIEGAIADACNAADRSPGSVTLIAVSKTVPRIAVEQILVGGHRVFGENRVQEARAKWPSLRTRLPDLELHLIGPLQANKVRDAVALFDAIHSVDSPRLCKALARHCANQARQPKLFVQVNTGREPQKAGVLPEDTDSLLDTCRELYRLEIAGLMCIPPVHDEPGRHFALLAKIAARNGLKCLSMGMSTDFVLAIAFGATHVRVGRAIFGAR